MNTTPDWFPTFFVFVLLLAGVGMLEAARRVRRRGRRSLAWPAAPGTVTASGVAESTSQDSDGSFDTSYVPEVRYEYRVDGRVLVGNRIRVGGTMSESKSRAAEEIAAQYAVGSKVEVFYDPASPDYSVLVRGTDSRMVTLFSVFGIVSSVAVGRRLRDDIRGQHGAAAGTLLYDYALLPFFAEFLADHAREDVDGAGGWKRHDDAHRAGGEGLRRYGADPE